MKKIISLILATVTLLLTISTAYASELGVCNSKNIIYFEDGGYALIEFYSSSATARGTTSKSKIHTRYNDQDEMLWKVTLTGTFTYNGTTSSCSSANCTVTIYDDNWYTYSKTSSKSGNTAYATVEMARKFLGVTVRKELVDLTLTCDKNGNFS